MALDPRKSKQTIFNQSSDFLIGELLLKAGLINKNQLDEALKLAGNKHMQVGQMLIMARHITPRDLQAAIDAQSAVRDRVMELSSAIRALSLATHQGITFNEAAQKQSHQMASLAQTNRLGDLLTAASLISAEQLAHAMQRSMATGLPLGRMLVLSGVINEAILGLALETQIRLRDGGLDRNEAIACLREMGGAKTVDQSGTAQLDGSGHAKLKQPRKHGIRLGELLVLAGILSEMDVMNALEFSLTKERQLGQVLIEHGYITEELCQTALKLQSLIDSGNLDPSQAADSLKSMLSTNVGLVQALEQVTNATTEGNYVNFQALITESQLLNQDEVQGAMELAVSNPRLMTKILIMTGYADEIKGELILTCYDALIKNRITWQDALNMLSYCWERLKSENASLEELLAHLNLSEGAQHQTGILTSQPGLGQSGEPIKHTGRTTTGIPALSQLQAENSLLHPSIETPNPQPPPKPEKKRTGKTTTNVPALNQLMAGGDLLRPGSHTAGQDQSKPALPKQSLSLKKLLTGHDIPAVGGNAKEQSTPAQNQQQSDENQDALELSDQEKKLIQAASSLNASPEDIMAAMQLALQKENSADPSEEEEKQS